MIKAILKISNTLERNVKKEIIVNLFFSDLPKEL
jgi:hypothetical protein